MPYPTETVVVRHPEADLMVALNPAIDYDPADVLVKAYPWAFKSKPRPAKVESVSIEAASAEPGEKRSRSKK